MCHSDFYLNELDVDVSLTNTNSCNFYHIEYSLLGSLDHSHESHTCFRRNRSVAMTSVVTEATADIFPTATHPVHYLRILAGLRMRYVRHAVPRPHPLLVEVDCSCQLPAQAIDCSCFTIYKFSNSLNNISVREVRWIVEQVTFALRKEGIPGNFSEVIPPDLVSVIFSCIIIVAFSECIFIVRK